MEGPRRAPSSPPETPVPMNKNPLPSRYLARRRGVLEERIAAVNNNVALFQMRQDLPDQVVHRLAGFDHEHDAARALEQAGQFGQRMGADDLRALGFAAEKLIHPGDRAVEHGHGEAVVIHVEDEVLAHDGQTDQSNISLSFHRMHSNRW